MRLVLDVQGFKDEHNKFIPKELATYDGNRIGHYVFKQPFPLRLLSPDLHKQALWLMKNYHCINWNVGYTPLHYFSTIINELTRDATFVFIKGGEKVDYIKKYCTKPIVELNEKPLLHLSTPKCFFHTKTPAMCALYNVFYLYDNFFMNE